MPTAGGAAPTNGAGIVVLRHNKVHLALHHLRAARADGDGPRPLLLLHGLGEQTRADVPADVETWPGAIWGLDFTGHGRSTIPKGGGYTCELLMADADVALAHLGSATLVGRGLGGYVAILLAGARPTVVRGAVVVDGPGLDGGGTSAAPRSGPAVAPDPYVLHELASDVRSTEYAAGYAREAVRGSGLRPAVVVCCEARPAWLSAVLKVDGVETADHAELAGALQRFA